MIVKYEYVLQRSTGVVVVFTDYEECMKAYDSELKRYSKDRINVSTQTSGCDLSNRNDEGETKIVKLVVRKVDENYEGKSAIKVETRFIYAPGDINHMIDFIKRMKDNG